MEDSWELEVGWVKMRSLSGTACCPAIDFTPPDPAPHGHHLYRRPRVSTLIGIIRAKKRCRKRLKFLADRHFNGERQCQRRNWRYDQLPVVVDACAPNWQRSISTCWRSSRNTSPDFCSTTSAHLVRVSIAKLGMMPACGASA